MVFRSTYLVHTSPVECHGVERSQDSDVPHLRVFGRGHTIAIHRKFIGHADIQDTVTAMVGHSFGRFGHRL